MKLLQNLERKARYATMNTVAAKKIQRKIQSIDRKLASGKISKSVAQVLKRLQRQRRKIMILRWIYAFLRGETTAQSPN